MSFFRYALCGATFIFFVSCTPQEIEKDPCLISEPQALSYENLLGYVGTDEKGTKFVESLLPGYGAPRSRVFPCNGAENLVVGQNIYFSVQNLNSLDDQDGYYSFTGSIFNAEVVSVLAPATSDCQPISDEKFDGESKGFRILNLKSYKDEFSDQYCLEVTLRYRGCPDAKAELYNSDYNLGFVYREMSIALDYAPACETVQYQQFRFNISSMVDPVIATSLQDPVLELV